MKIVGVGLIIFLLVYSCSHPVRLNSDSILMGPTSSRCQSCARSDDSCGFLEGINNGITVPGAAIRLAFTIIPPVRSIGGAFAYLLLTPFALGFCIILVPLFAFVCLFQGGGTYLLGYLPFASVMVIVITPFLPPSQRVLLIIFFQRRR